MPKTSGYWYRPPGGEWQLRIQTRDDDFNPMTENWLPMDGPASLMFCTHGQLSQRKIRRLYRKQRQWFGFRPWYRRLWDWLLKAMGEKED